MDTRELEDILLDLKEDILSNDYTDDDIRELALRINRKYRKQQNNTCEDSKKNIEGKISYEEFMKQMDDVNVSDVFKEKQWLSYCSEFRPHINNVDLVSLAEAYRAIDRVRERS